MTIWGILKKFIQFTGQGKGMFFIGKLFLILNTVLIKCKKF